MSSSFFQYVPSVYLTSNERHYNIHRVLTKHHLSFVHVIHSMNTPLLKNRVSGCVYGTSRPLLGAILPLPTNHSNLSSRIELWSLFFFCVCCSWVMSWVSRKTSYRCTSYPLILLLGRRRTPEKVQGIRPSGKTLYLHISTYRYIVFIYSISVPHMGQKKGCSSEFNTITSDLVSQTKQSSSNVSSSFIMPLPQHPNPSHLPFHLRNIQ